MSRGLSVVQADSGGLHKAEVIHRQSRKNREAIELTTLNWVDWFNHRRLLEPVGHILPAEVEAQYYRQMAAPVAG